MSHFRSSAAAHLPPGAPEVPEAPASPLHDLKLQRLIQAVRGYSAEQLLWSSGYLAGLASARSVPSWEPIPDPAPEPAAVPSATAVRLPAAIGLTILYASQTGNARAVAEDLGRQAAAQQIPHRVISAADFRPRDLLKERLLLLTISTQGEGEPPESAHELHRYLFGPGAPRLTGLSYAVFGLGDSSYEHFCHAARDFDRRLEVLGAHRLLDRVDADLDFGPVSQSWFPGALARVAAELTLDSPSEGQVPSRHRDAAVITLRAAAPTRHDREHPQSATLVDNRPLTTRDAIAQVQHLAIRIDAQALSYAPGDALGVWFRNDPALVERIIAATGLTGDAAVELGGEHLSLTAALTARRELTRLHPTLVAAWAEVAQAPSLTDLIQDRDALRAYCRQHQVIDLATTYPIRPAAQALAGLLQPLQPRLYSIASSQAELDDEVHLAVTTLRYRRNGEERLGGASGFLAERLPVGDSLAVYVAENPSFRLPSDGDTPIVLIGAGTGIAPFRAFLQQRAIQGARGRNWLVFGNRHFQRDFLYQTDWLRWRKEGLLHRFSPAFSRDTEQRIYVQDRLRKEGAELWCWLADGARIYVCGATAMEAAVRETLIGIARDHGGLSQDAAAELFGTLRRDARYLRDTY